MDSKKKMYTNSNNKKLIKRWKANEKKPLFPSSSSDLDSF